MKQEKKQKQVRPKKIEESLSYTAEVRDKEGRVLQRLSAPARSFVQQWNQQLQIMTQQATHTVLDITGTPRNWAGVNTCFACNGAIGDATKGLVVGKGTTAIAIDDYCLETKLGEGTGVDEFEHQANTWTIPAVVGSTCSFTIKRIFINNSGATISDIREIGCYYKAVYSHLGWRDVLPSGVTVPHGGSITVTYTLKVTV